jgi:hypothetical protein
MGAGMQIGTRRKILGLPPHCRYRLMGIKRRSGQWPQCQGCVLADHCQRERKNKNEEKIVSIASTYFNW